MVDIAISILWFLIALIVLCVVIYIAIWVIESFVQPIPDRIKQAIWVIVLLLALIAMLSILAGGGGGWFRHATFPGACPATLSTCPA